ncbi:MAG: hypothetical protein R3B84_07915 [Zavarzinella sp.]
MQDSLLPIFGVMKFEFEPQRFGDIPRLLLLMVEYAGAFSIIAVILWLIHAFVNPIYVDAGNGKRKNQRLDIPQLAFAAVSIVSYLIAIFLLGTVTQENLSAEDRAAIIAGKSSSKDLIFNWSLRVGGLFGLAAFLWPFILDCTKMSFRRIFAIAKLSFLEAIRQRVFLVFFGFLLLAFFPSGWFFQDKDEDQLKTLIQVAMNGMTVLLIAVAVLLASFSIPNDIKSLSIYTIVTKPVQRFEIILGRFLGYVGLLTIALLIMSTGSLLLLYTSTLPKAAVEETMKARVALYGDRLEFTSRQAAFTGVDVGREEAYRKYITGRSSERAVWHFSSFPSSLTRLESIPLESGFDIYRTTKGDERINVLMSVEVVTHNWDPSKQDEFDLKVEKVRNSLPNQQDRWKQVDELAQQYGRYVYVNQNIRDYHTQAIPIPPGIFKNALNGSPPPGPEGIPGTRLQVRVRCDTPSQYLGMAKHDLYLLESNGSFALNYYKGAYGLWLRLVLVIALAVTLSTYFSGVISLLITVGLIVAGTFIDFIISIARGENPGGGPTESALRLFTRKTAAAELESNSANAFLQLMDKGYRWVLRRFEYVLPDTTRYSFFDYLAYGFNINFELIFLNSLMLFGYLLCWFVSAYYIMKAREIAA